MIHLYEKENESYTISGDIYNYEIRLVDVDVCDPDLYLGTSCINTIELNILQKHKYTNEVIKTVVVPDIVKVRDIEMSNEFEDIKFDAIFVFTIYFDRGAANFKINYTKKDVVRGMNLVYSGELTDTPLSLYFGEGDKVYPVIVNSTGERLIVNVRDNQDSKTLYGLPDDILAFGSIMVRVMNKTDNGIRFTIYSPSNVKSLEKSEISLRKGETSNIGGMDFKISDASALSATINVDNQDYAIRKRSFKGISNFIFEVNDVARDTVKLNIYHQPSVSIVGYNPNVSLTVTKKLESEEGDIFEIPFTLANTGRAHANNLKVNLQSSSGNIVEGSWSGSLNVGETKELKFKARFDEPGDYVLIFNVNAGQTTEGFQEEVSVKSKVTSVLKEGPMKSLIFIAGEYILTPDRIRLAQNSINIFLYVGILLSSLIVINSARQKLPNMEIQQKRPKKNIVKRKQETSNVNGRPIKREEAPTIKKRNDVAMGQERIKPPRERKEGGIKKKSVKKRE